MFTRALRLAGTLCVLLLCASVVAGETNGPTINEMEKMASGEFTVSEDVQRAIEDAQARFKAKDLEGAKRTLTLIRRSRTINPAE